MDLLTIRHDEVKVMKKIYIAPTVERVNFDYKNQIVASGGSSTCKVQHSDYVPVGSIESCSDELAPQYKT